MEELCFIPTRGSARKQETNEVDFQTTVFEAYKAKGKRKQSDGDVATDSVPKRMELDMKKVRFEVFKFGVSGFNAKKKADVNIAHAIQLGAKPHKKKNQNYKELMIARKRAKEREAEEKRLVAAGKVKGVSSDKGKKWMYGSKRRENKSGILQPYGKPGEVKFKKKKKKQ